VYNGYTTETNANLVYDPDELTRWQHFWRISFPAFWRSWWGRGLAIGIFSIVTVAVIIASFIVGPKIWIPYLKGVGIASAFFFGIAAWNGYQSHRRGGNFWETFKNHINDNWAMSLAFTGLIMAAMIGLKIAKAAKAKAAKKQPLPSVAQPQNSDLFRVGVYDELPIIEGMNRHHVGQGAVMKKLIPRLAELMKSLEQLIMYLISWILHTNMTVSADH